MPQIIVTAGSGRDVEEGSVMLRERVSAADFESQRFAANLLERLGWAVEDATAAERQGRLSAGGGDQSGGAEPEVGYEWDPEPVGIA
jgi:hypothetical protein